MNLSETVLQKLDSGAVARIAGRIGIGEEQTKAAVASALPLILAGLQRNASRPEGAAALDRALEKDHDGGILGQLGELLSGGGPLAEGSAILGHVFGSRQRNVEKGVATVARIDPDQAAQLLASLAPIVMGALGQARREAGLGAKDLTDLLETEGRRVQQRQPETSGLVGMLLDSDGDGDVDVSDLAKKGAGLLRGFFR